MEMKSSQNGAVNQMERTGIPTHTHTHTCVSVACVCTHIYDIRATPPKKKGVESWEFHRRADSIAQLNEKLFFFFKSDHKLRFKEFPY